MKMPEPHRIVQGFGMEAEYLYTQEQMREALAQHEAVMRMALECLKNSNAVSFDDLHAIKALEEQLK